MSVAFIIQQVKRMRRIILPFVACLVLPYFSTLSHKRHDFRGKKIIEHKIFVLIFTSNFVYETFLILERIQRDISVHKPSCKVPVIFVRIS